MFIHSALPSSCLAQLWQEGSELNTLLVHAASVEVVKKGAFFCWVFFFKEDERQTETKQDFKLKEKLYRIVDETLVSRAD